MPTDIPARQVTLAAGVVTGSAQARDGVIAPSLSTYDGPLQTGIEYYGPSPGGTVNVFTPLYAGADGAKFNTFLQSGISGLVAIAGTSNVDLSDYTYVSGFIQVPAAVTGIVSLTGAPITMGYTLGTHETSTSGILRVGSSSFVSLNALQNGTPASVANGWTAVANSYPSMNTLATAGDNGIVISGTAALANFPVGSYCLVATDYMTTGIFPQPSADGLGQKINSETHKVASSYTSGGNTYVIFQDAFRKTYLKGNFTVYPQAPVRGPFFIQNVSFLGNIGSSATVSVVQFLGVFGLNLVNTGVSLFGQYGYDIQYCRHINANAANVNNGQTNAGVNTGYGIGLAACTDIVWQNSVNTNTSSLLGSVFISRSGSANCLVNNCFGMSFDIHGMDDALYVLSNNDCMQVNAGNAKWSYGPRSLAISNHNQGYCTVYNSTFGQGTPDSQLYQYGLLVQNNCGSVTCANADFGFVFLSSPLKHGEISVPTTASGGANGNSFSIQVAGTTIGTVTLGTTPLGIIYAYFAQASGLSTNLNGLYIGNGSGNYASQGYASCTSGTISTTTLTIGGTITGSFAVGQMLIGTGVTANTYITSLLSGNGTTAGSTFGLSQSSTVSTGEVMYAGGPTVLGYGAALYSGTTSYVVGNQVTYNSGSIKTYQCIAATTGNLPTNATYWIQVSSQNSDNIVAGFLESLNPASYTLGVTNITGTGVVANNTTFNQALQGVTLTGVQRIYSFFDTNSVGQKVPIEAAANQRQDAVTSVYPSSLDSSTFGAVSISGTVSTPAKIVNRYKSGTAFSNGLAHQTGGSSKAMPIYGSLSFNYCNFWSAYSSTTYPNQVTVQSSFAGNATLGITNCNFYANWAETAAKYLGNDTQQFNSGGGSSNSGPNTTLAITISGNTINFNGIASAVSTMFNPTAGNNATISETTTTVSTTYVAAPIS